MLLDRQVQCRPAEPGHRRGHPPDSEPNRACRLPQDQPVRPAMARSGPRATTSPTLMCCGSSAR